MVIISDSGFQDGLHGSALISCALLLYSKALSTKDEVINLFNTRRCQTPLFSSADLKILDYMSQISTNVQPHSIPLVLHSITIQPVPLFTKARDGCRPYVDVYSGGSLVCTTRNTEYYSIRLYNVAEGKVMIQFPNVIVRGDITIVMFHARQQLGRVIGIKIASIYFHSGFLPTDETSLIFGKSDMDDAPDIGGSFKALLNFEFANSKEEKSTNLKNHSYLWESKQSYKPSPSVLFESALEMEETLQNFRKFGEPVLQEIPKIEQEHFAEESEPLRHEEESEDEERPPREKSPETANLLEADLLNLSSSPEPNTNAATKPNSNLFANQNENDIFGNFTSFTPAPPSNGSDNFQPNGSNRNANANDVLFDPLGGWNAAKSQEENIPRNSSTPNFGAQNKDPFANLTDSFNAGLASSWSGREAPNLQPTTPLAGTPTHSSPHMSKANVASNENVNATTSAKKPADAFEDLLGSQGYNFRYVKDAEKHMHQIFVRN